MQCGISSACLYPCETKDALAQIAGLQAGPVEIFLNTFRELDEDYLAGLARTVRAAGCRVTSLHPFTCALEPFLFFTEYQNRFEDGVALYRRYFHWPRKMWTAAAAVCRKMCGCCGTTPTTPPPLCWT